MGYAHCWEQKVAADPAQWAAITSDFQRLLAHSPVPIVQDSDDSTPPIVDEHEVFFNGAGADGYETMALYRAGSGFYSCKTARKPYDLLVTALLILVRHHAPGVCSISSDGNAADWQPTLDWMNSVSPVRYRLP